MYRKILIIKLGAMGDVLRTTPILHILDGEITWVSSKESIPILKNNSFINRLLTIDSIDEIKDETFDLVLSLDEDYTACKLATTLKSRRIIGANLQNGKIGYTESSKDWFNMSKISRKGIKIANILKRKNILSYQEILFKIMGKEFSGEGYILNDFINNESSDIIGFESRVGEGWPTKLWKKYNELAHLLKKEGFKVVLFKQRKNIHNYIEDINKCKMVVTGDTLAMHLGLALKKRVIALFGPTSSTEIYDYGRLSKIVSTANCICCYRRNCNKKPNCMDLIAVNKVYDVITKIK